MAQKKKNPNEEKSENKNNIYRTTGTTKSSSKSPVTISGSPVHKSSPSKGETSRNTGKSIKNKASMVANKQEQPKTGTAYTDPQHRTGQQKKKSNAERLLENLPYQASSDANSTILAFHEARRNYAQDKSHQEITNDWTETQKNKYHSYQDPQKAASYATKVNDEISRQRTEPIRQNIRREASKSVLDGAIQTAGALGASVLFSVPEFIDRVAEFSVRGRTTEKNIITPKEYSQEVVSGIADTLNGTDENGVPRSVLPEDIPFFGGKGIGDVYKFGFQALESWLSANGVGKTATLANAFARTAADAMDTARKLGADGKQSMALGITKGALDVASEALPLEELLNLGPAATVKDLAKKVLRQSALEGASDTIYEGLGQMADYAILGDFSTFSRRRNFYMTQRGLPAKQAYLQAYRDSLQDLGYTMMAGLASGALKGAAQSAKNTIEEKLTPKSEDVHYTLSDLRQARNDLRKVTGSYYKNTLAGQSLREPIEKRFEAIKAYYQRQIDADEALKQKVIQDQLAARQPGYQPPFDAGLYRMAVEKFAPYGYEIPMQNTPEITAVSDYTDKIPSTNQQMNAILHNRVESPGGVGEKAIPYSERGIEIEPRIKGYMEQLNSEGVYISDKAGSYNMEDLQIMTAETGMEYTMLTIDGKSYVIRGSERGTPIPDELAETLYGKQGDFVCHTHPYIGDLNPSKSDLDFMKSLTWQQESIIIDPAGEITVFDKNGVKEKKTISTHRDENYYQKMFGG